MQAALEKKAEIIEGLASGKRLSDLNLGISPQAISKSLKADPEYRQAIETGLEVRLDASERAIEESADQVAVARARARFQSVSWRAEREFPERWGGVREAQLPQIVVNLVAYTPQSHGDVIEHNTPFRIAVQKDDKTP